MTIRSCEHALELALRLKEQLVKAAHITVSGVGCDHVEVAIRRGLALGCDRVIHVDHVACRDPSQISAVISRFCRKSSFDLILTGTSQGRAGPVQIGSLVAERLGCSSAGVIVGLSLSEDSRTLNCELKEGGSPALRLDLPVVATCGIVPVTPRFPAFSSLLMARKKEIIVYPAAAFLEGEGRGGAGPVHFAPVAARAM